MAKSIIVKKKVSQKSKQSKVGSNSKLPLLPSPSQLFKINRVLP
jgi:hypothetical protein